MTRECDTTPCDTPMTVPTSSKFYFTRQDLSVYEVIISNGRVVEMIQMKEGQVPAYCYRCKKEHKGSCQR
jgi:hypothetical protein